MKGFALALLLGFLAVVSPAADSPTNAGPSRIDDVIYGRKFGTALTMDVLRPAKPNGHGVVAIISGAWFSSREMMKPAEYQPFLDRGYTVFAVYHGAQPKFQIPEMIQDVHRAVRFIRHEAARFRIDPDHLGATGASAGGTLALALGTQGGPGPSDAKDPVDRESSAVQAVAVFYPATDYLNFGKPGEDAVGVGIRADIKPAFGSGADTPEVRQALGRIVSPIYHVSANMAPTLILHGDADKRVPLQQAESFVERATQAGGLAKLVVRPGKGHGWPWPDRPADVALLADWFDEHLRAIQR